MPRYHYRALDHSGAVQEGEMTAATARDVIARLQADGFIPVRAEPLDGADASTAAAPMRQPKLAYRARAIDGLFNELAVMLNAGVELEHALASIARANEGRPLAALAAELRRQVREGRSFSQALSTSSHRFSNVERTLASAGEAAGRLPLMLKRVAEHRERTRELNDALLTASLYPLILLTVGGLSVVAVSVFVLPRFAALFSDAGIPLPWLTEVVMSAGLFMSTWWWALIAGAALLTVAIRTALRDENTRRRFDALALRVPVLGTTIATLNIARFTGTFGTLIECGVPVLDALRVARRVIGNVHLRERASDIAAKVRDGQRFASALSAAQMLGPAAISMFEAGEKTGRLGPVASEVGGLYERDFRKRLDRTMVVLEPILVLLMAAFVAVVVFALLLAVLALGDVPV